VTGARVSRALLALLLAGCMRSGWSERWEARDDAHVSDAVMADDHAVEASHDGTPADTVLLDGKPAADSTPSVDLAPQPDENVSDVGLPPAGCNPSFATVDAVVGSKMVVCKASGKVTTYNQCQAESKLCNTAGGWKLCAASVYRAQFKSSKPPALLAWIGGCVRSGAAPHTPTDGVCSKCSGPSKQAVNCFWPCIGGGAPLVGEPYVGLTTANACNQVGTATPATEAYWTATPASSEKPRAMCCLVGG